MVQFNDSGQANVLLKKFTRRVNSSFNRENLDDLLRYMPENVNPAIILGSWHLMLSKGEEIYPGCVDLQFNFGYEHRFHENTYGTNHATFFDIWEGPVLRDASFIIRFPEFTIKNRDNRERTIYDLFVSIPMKIRNGHAAPLEFGAIQGTRTTLAYEEARANYQHSHLHSVNVLADGDSRSGNAIRCQWDNFCLGSENDYTATRSLLNSEFDLDLFELALHQIRAYVEYESLEGGPYIRMESIATAHKTRVRELNELHCSRMFKDFLIHQESLPVRDRMRLDLNWVIRQDGKYAVVHDERFEDMCYQMLTALPLVENNVLVFRDQRGIQYTDNTLEDVNSGVKREYLIFRNDKIFFTILPRIHQTTPDMAQRKRYANINFIEYVKRRLEETANITKVRKAAIQQLTY